MLTTEEAGARIRECVAKVKAKGAQIVCGAYGVTRYGTDRWLFVAPKYPFCCALGAVLIVRGGDADMDNVRTIVPTTPETEAAKALGVDTAWIGAFVAGFDGSRNVDGTPAGALGLQLREEFKATKASVGMV